MPDEVANLLALQKARIDLGAAGAEAVQFRGGKLTVTGIELDSEGSGRLAERVKGALYEWRSHEVSIRVENDPEVRLAAIGELGSALAELASRPEEPAAAAGG